MSAKTIRYDRVLRLRTDAATDEKIDKCLAAERERSRFDAAEKPSRSSVIRNAVDAYYEYLVCGYSLLAEDDPRRTLG